VEEIYLAKKQGWLFKQGSDSAWARRELDISTWRKLRPVDIKASMADSNGIFEGWFRAYIKIDSSFGDIPFYFYFGTYAAQDIYIDGQLIESAGNTGTNGLSYSEHVRPNDFNESIRIHQLKSGGIYLFVWHIKDVKALSNPNKLKAEFDGLHNLFELVSTRYNTWLKDKQNFVRSALSFTHVFVFVLMLLFWLLWFLNAKEKNILRFAIFTTAYFLLCSNINIAASVWYSFSFDERERIALGLVLALTANFILGYSPYLLANIFKHKFLGLTEWMVFFPITSLLIVKFVKLGNNIGNILTFLPVLYILFCIYIIFSSYKKFNRSNLVIVTGVMLSLVCLIIVSATFWRDSVYHYYRAFTLIIITGISFPIALMIYVVFRFKEMIVETREKATQIVQLSEEKRIQAENQQKVLEEEVAKQTIELRNSLSELKSTQAQLIQSEKMASLGELTAGIAHEIQNPLNFVNNFSEVSNELIDEMKAELDKGEIEEAKAIATDIQQNLSKIAHHGKRADSIVKGMLQHSRSSTGQKELTDINVLCDEYLRLSYHGLRAKDKQFQAQYETVFDPALQAVPVMAQEIGRVVLNLINNAFYAVHEKQKQVVASGKGESYKPTVLISTSLTDKMIAIEVKDNGNGIPAAIREKIFQPFFTTKPVGEGTGLGLSLSYDIITKGHGGKLTVQSEEGVGTSFRILLPIT
jgi:signal transduction histidine kinase